MIKREVYLRTVRELIDTDFIKVFTGIRRSGKTTLLHSIMDLLKEKGISENNIIYISFESAKYQTLTNFEELNEVVHDLTRNIDDRIYLFFDEIQHIEQWEKSINGFRVDLNCDIYVTGSNSSLLSGEYATLLTGRYIEIKVYPFSFKEMIQYKKENENLILTNENKRQLFDEYVKFGGMPSLLEIEKESIKKTALNDIYSSIIYNI